MRSHAVTGYGRHPPRRAAWTGAATRRPTAVISHVAAIRNHCYRSALFVQAAFSQLPAREGQCDVT